MTATAVRSQGNAVLASALAGLKICGIRSVDVAKAAGMDATTLSRLVHGHRLPTPAQAERVAAAVDLSVERLWPDLEHG